MKYFGHRSTPSHAQISATNLVLTLCSLCMRIMRIFSVPSKVCLRTLNFNRRSPHGERRSPHIQRFVRLGFQATLPVRGAPALYGAYRQVWQFQSTLPVRGATGPNSPVEVVTLFQSTLPVRGATQVNALDDLDFRISIHAPREGSDPSARGCSSCPGYFNPRSP